MSEHLTGNDAAVYGRQSCRTFDSYADFVDFATQPASETNAGHPIESRTSPSQNWDLGLGWNKSVELAREGWAEMAAQIEATANEVKSRIGRIESLGHQPTWAMSGGTVSVGRAMSGQRDCMRRMTLRPTLKDSPVVTIVVDMSMSAAVSADTYVKRGATILALLDIVRSVGIPTEVWLTNDADDMDATKSKPTGCSHLIRLVHADQRIDLQELAFALAHPASLRRIGFGAREADDPFRLMAYGCPRKAPSPYTMDRINPTIALNGTRTSVGEAGDVVSRPVDWIIAQLRGAGLPVD